MRKELRRKKRADLALAMTVFVRAHAGCQLAGQQLLFDTCVSCWRFKHDMLAYTAWILSEHRGVGTSLFRNMEDECKPVNRTMCSSVALSKIAGIQAKQPTPALVVRRLAGP